MDNLEYLKKVKEARNNELKVLGTIATNEKIEKVKMELRKVYALEIIAETLIGIYNKLESIDRRRTMNTFV